MQLLRRMKIWLKTNLNASQTTVIEYLNPILRGWGNFYRPLNSKDAFNYIDNFLWEAIWKWCLRKHPNKGKRWVKNKYFHKIKGRQWVFAVRKKDKKKSDTWKCLFKLSDIQIRRHALVKGTSSPDDPQLKEYWRKRQQNNARETWKNGSRFYRVIEKQKGICSLCREDIFNGETIHLHHKTPIKEGGGEEVNNLVWLHKICHQQIHSNKLLLERLKA